MFFLIIFYKRLLILFLLYKHPLNFFEQKNMNEEETDKVMNWKEIQDEQEKIEKRIKKLKNELKTTKKRYWKEKTEQKEKLKEIKKKANTALLKKINKRSKKKEEEEERVNKRDEKWVNKVKKKYYEKKEKKFEAYFTCKNLDEETTEIKMYEVGTDIGLPFCEDSKYIYMSHILKTKSRIPIGNIEIAKEKLIKDGYIEKE